MMSDYSISLDTDDSDHWFWSLASVLFFAGGFVLDALTIGRFVNLWTLSYVGLYALAVPVLIGVLESDWLDRWSHWINWSLHFSLGAVFSALIVLYFRSVGHLSAGVSVALLMAAMIWNETAARDRPARWLVWAIYAASLVMYVNFLLPFLVGSISAWWFYGSLVAVVCLLVGLFAVGVLPSSGLVSGTGLAGLLVILYVAGAIPPVPLVMKQTHVCVEVEKINGSYACQTTRNPRRLGLTTPRVPYKPGERVSAMTSVAAPRGVEADIEHRWYHWESDGWVLYDTVPVHLHGGREAGWRFYSFKENMLPGLWRVETGLVEGPLLSYQTFKAKPVPEDEELRRRTFKLR
jgi:hypothetical protein